MERKKEGDDDVNRRYTERKTGNGKGSHNASLSPSLQCGSGDVGLGVKSREFYSKTPVGVHESSSTINI